MPLSRADEAVDRLRAGQPRFRIVLEPDGRP
jgi:D-arabinose 1-dehydrogenase-like Zn-dependent alcohol dehydrogenase